MSNADDKTVLVTQRKGTALVTLNRPDKRNAIDIAMRKALAETITMLRDDDSVKAVIFHGAGDNFCGGGDLVALTETRRSGYANRERLRDLHRWFRELVNLEKPVIAAVDGAAYGAGFNLALAADFIICTPRTRFCQVFQRIGVLPDLGGMYLLPRIVGLQRAKDLILTARELLPDEAMSWGMLHSIVEPDQLLNRAHVIADRFQTASTPSIGIAKHLLNQSFHLDQHAMAELEAANQALAFDSEYHLDAVKRFKQHHPPLYGWEE